MVRQDSESVNDKMLINEEEERKEIPAGKESQQLNTNEEAKGK